MPIRRVRRRARLALIGVIGVSLPFLEACNGNDAVELPTPSGSYQEGTVTGVLMADGRFEALVALLEMAEVSQGPPASQQVIGNAAEVAGRPGWDHTVFAPTNEAFSSWTKTRSSACSMKPTRRSRFGSTLCRTCSPRTALRPERS